MAKNIGEALTEIRVSKSELDRLLTARRNSFTHRADEEVSPEEDYDALTKSIDKKMEDIRKLKIAVSKANLNKIVDTPEGTMPLAEAILLVGEYRSKLAMFQNLSEQFRDRRISFMSKDDVKTKQQKKMDFINNEIRNFEERKARLDNFIQAINWQVELK